MSLVSSKSQKIFLCSNSKIETNSKVDIILSPEFYWVRVFELPVKTVSAAKQVLPTLFEDILETVNELSYQVIKLEENRYLCFAYINKKIYEAIKSSGINLALVNSVYFAQNECKDYEQFSVDDKAFLYTNDNILVKVPNALLSQNVNLNDNLENITLSSNKVDIKLYNNLLSPKQINMIIIACLIICSINVFKIFDYQKSLNLVEENIEKIKANSSMPSSLLQVNSIINSYKKVIDLEEKKREALVYILQNKEFKLSNLELKKDILNLSFEGADKNKIDKYLAKKYKIISSRVKDLVLNVEVKL